MSGSLFDVSDDDDAILPSEQKCRREGFGQNKYQESVEKRTEVHVWIG